eukprot:scaffold528_cov126-Isochrysis_galbana.AAC.2
MYRLCQELLLTQSVHYDEDAKKTPVWVSHATRTCRKAAPFTDIMSTTENNNLALSKRARSTPAPNETVRALRRSGMWRAQYFIHRLFITIAVTPTEPPMHDLSP